MCFVSHITIVYPGSPSMFRMLLAIPDDALAPPRGRNMAAVVPDAGASALGSDHGNVAGVFGVL